MMVVMTGGTYESIPEIRLLAISEWVWALGVLPCGEIVSQATQ